tara:strand:- start:5150 stop:6787 length:1638 start_codon:yes stop_codon:yes gene_type:complete
MEGESELIGNLSLVGMRGNFVAVLNQRQLTIENRIGQGLRIDLNSISKMRHINIPILPSGTPVIGAVAVAIGYSILVPPIGWVVSLAGAFASLSYFRLRSSVLVIEDNDKSRHMIGGREGSLMRLCLMSDRLRRGLSVEEARVGLEEIENELPLFPAFQDAGGMPAPKALPWPPSPPEIQTVGSGIEAEIIIDSGEVVPAISESVNFDFNMFGDVKEESVSNNDTASNPIVSQVGSFETSRDSATSAYERAWGREEASWYREKERPLEIQNGFDTINDEPSDMFGFGGMFDDDVIHEPKANSFVGFDSPIEKIPTNEDRMISPSSSEMIRRAHSQHGAPTTDYRREGLLPSPTQEAVREECVPGIVRQARAKQADSRKSLTNTGGEATDLHDYPGVSSLVASMNGGRLSRGLAIKERSKPSWIESLLRPRSRARHSKEDSYASQYGDSDGANFRVGERFQTSQYIRLRSDQDHQADLIERHPMVEDVHPVSAKEALYSVVDRVSMGRAKEQRKLSIPSGGLKFSQLRKAQSKGEKHHIPGVRRLE